VEYLTDNDIALHVTGVDNLLQEFIRPDQLFHRSGGLGDAIIKLKWVWSINNGAGWLRHLLLGSQWQ
jgi:hypothetical protein